MGRSVQYGKSSTVELTMPGADGAGFGRTTLSHGGKTARERMGAPPTRRQQLDANGNVVPGEAQYSPGYISSRLPPISARSPGKNLPGKVPEAQAKALARTREHRQKFRFEDTQQEVPITQVRQMLQGRMQSIVMQDRQQVRKLFRTWDRENTGELTAEQFHGLLHEFGVDTSKTQSKEIMDKFASTKPGCITFGELFFNLMGFPPDFFTMNLCEKPGEEVERTQIRPVLPASMPDSQVEHIFKTRLRKVLFNVEAVVNQVFERSATRKNNIDQDDFWTMMNTNGMQLTPAETAELFCYFDQNCDGLVQYYELAHELIKLPRPMGNRHQKSWHSRRPKLGGRCAQLLRKLEEKCERAAAPPAALYNLFKTYDEDGSGCIAYDEMQEMVRETGTNVQGKDMAAILLDKYSKGTGEIPYMKFIVNVLELSPDALTVAQKTGTIVKPRAATPEVVQKISSGIKQRVYNNPEAVIKAFKMFDQDQDGHVRIAEFMEGLRGLGLPIKPAQMRTLFAEFNGGISGKLELQSLANKVLAQAAANSASPTARSTTSAGFDVTHRSSFGSPKPFGSLRPAPDDGHVGQHTLKWHSKHVDPRRTQSCTPHTEYEYRSPNLGRPPKTAMPLTSRTGFSLSKMGCF